MLSSNTFDIVISTKSSLNLPDGLIKAYNLNFRTDWIAPIYQFSHYSWQQSQEFNLEEVPTFYLKYYTCKIYILPNYEAHLNYP